MLCCTISRMCVLATSLVPRPSRLHTIIYMRLFFKLSKSGKVWSIWWCQKIACKREGQGTRLSATCTVYGCMSLLSECIGPRQLHLWYAWSSVVVVFFWFSMGEQILLLSLQTHIYMILHWFLLLFMGEQILLPSFAMGHTFHFRSSNTHMSNQTEGFRGWASHCKVWTYQEL